MQHTRPRLLFEMQLPNTESSTEVAPELEDAALDSFEVNENGFVNEKKRRRQIWEEQEGKCHYCGRYTVLPEALLAEYVEEIPEDKTDLIDLLLKEDADFKYRWHDDLATLEHLLPRGQGGTDARWNLVVACAKCNQEMGMIAHQQWMDAQAMYDKTSRRMARRGYRWDVLQGQWVKREN